MSYAIPLSSDPRREMFDMNDLVAIGTGDGIPMLFCEAIRRGRKLTGFSNGLIRRAFYICLVADDTLVLLSVGPRGGHKIEWVFGPYRLPAKLHRP